MRSPRNLVGKQWGTLVIESYLGRGVASWVYAVRADDGAYALKLFRPGFEPGSDARSRSAREKLCALAHPNLCRFFKLDQIGLEKGLSWYALMELIEGATLRSHLAGHGGTFFTDFQSIGLQLVDGLRALHRAGLSHGDIKPSNVMIEERTGRAVLTDFDLITESQNSQPRHKDKFRGSIQYAAPECLVTRSGSGDNSSDIFSLGLCFYEIVTGRPVFSPGISVLGRVRILNQRLKLNREDYPASVIQLVEAMLSNSPECRPDIESCRQELRSPSRL